MRQVMRAPKGRDLRIVEGLLFSSAYGIKIFVPFYTLSPLIPPLWVGQNHNLRGGNYPE